MVFFFSNPYNVFFPCFIRLTSSSLNGRDESRQSYLILALKGGHQFLFNVHCGTPAHSFRNSVIYLRGLPHPGFVPLPLAVLSLLLRNSIHENFLGIPEGQCKVAVDIAISTAQPRMSLCFQSFSPSAFFAGTPLHPLHFPVSVC